MKDDLIKVMQSIDTLSAFCMKRKENCEGCPLQDDRSESRFYCVLISAYKPSCWDRSMVYEVEK